MLFTKAYFIFPVKFRNLTYLSFLLFSTPKAVRNFEFSNSDPGDNLRFNQIPAEEFFFKDLRTIMYSFLRSKCSKVLNTANKCCHCINWRTFAFSPWIQQPESTYPIFKKSTVALNQYLSIDSEELPTQKHIKINLLIWLFHGCIVFKIMKDLLSAVYHF